MQKHQIKLLSKEELGTKLYKFTFTRDFDFNAGQFIAVEVGENLKRFYSIASTPDQEGLTVYVTTAPGGPGSKFFEAIQVGDSASVIGPLGTFTFKEPEASCFIATGTGVAPLISVIKHQLMNNQSVEMYLLYGVRYEDQIMVDAELEALAKTYPNFKYGITVTRPDQTWRGLEGRVTSHLQTMDVKNYKAFYICGVKDMVTDVKNILLSKGIDLAHIYTEVY